MSPTHVAAALQHAVKSLTLLLIIVHFMVLWHDELPRMYIALLEGFGLDRRSAHTKHVHHCHQRNNSMLGCNEGLSKRLVVSLPFKG